MTHKERQRNYYKYTERPNTESFPIHLVHEGYLGKCGISSGSLHAWIKLHDIHLCPEFWISSWLPIEFANYWISKVSWSTKLYIFIISLLNLINETFTYNFKIKSQQSLIHSASDLGVSSIHRSFPKTYSSCLLDSSDAVPSTCLLRKHNIVDHDNH